MGTQIMRAQEFLAELFNRPYPVKVFKDQAIARDSKGREIFIEFTRTPSWETAKVTFARGESGFDLTGAGDEMRVFATVVAAIREWAAQHEPGMIYFSVENSDLNRRAQLYQRMIRALVPGTNYQQVTRQDASQINDEAVSYWVEKLGTRFPEDTFFFLVRRDLLDADVGEGIAPVGPALPMPSQYPRRTPQWPSPEERRKKKVSEADETTPARQWIRKIYDEFYEHPFNPRHRVMTWGQGDDQELAIFELATVFGKPTTVDIKWFQAYPQRQGIGRRAMQRLQQLAQQDGITLTLYPWNRGEISQSKLAKIYRGMGFRPSARGSKDMTWQPQQQSVAEGSLNEFAISDNGAGDDYSLFNYAKMWYNGDLKTQKQVEKALQKIGLDIGENEDENGGAYISDMSGDYYESWTAEDFKQGVAEGKYDSTTFRIPRRKLNVPALIKAGAIFVTYPHGEQGWETDSKEAWAYSLISLYNVMSGGWAAEAKKYLKPQSYKHAEQLINSSAPNLGSNQLVYDGKYNQILWSIKKLDLADDVAFLDARGLAESLDQPYPLTWERSEYGDVDALAKLSDGTYLSIMFNQDGGDEWRVEFHRNNSQEVTGEGDSQRVFATVLKAIQQFIKKQRPWMLTFSANKEGRSDTDKQSRVRLYDRMVKRYAHAWGYETRQQELSDKVVYELNRTGEGLTEDESHTAISLSRLGQFFKNEDPLAELIPERAAATYALHPDKWESTFYSLTNKDPRKLKYYGPKKVKIPPGTLVGDMAIANKFYRATTDEEKQHYAKLYKKSLQPYPVDVSQYRMPELLIPKTVEENFADGAKPGRKGLSRRVGIPKKATLGQLEKIARSSSGERRRMAQWQLNMRRGRARKNKS
jgi:GNAT superfamily N-acetyltransferase